MTPIAFAAGLWIQIFIVLFLLGLGFFIGGRREQNHFARLARRRKNVSHILTSDVKTFPEGCHLEGLTPTLVTSQVVIASDYLKTFFGNIRQLVGGEMKSYQSLLVRAREESLIQLLERAEREGYDAVCNIRVDTADIGGNSMQRGVPTVGIMATGTAYRRSTDLPS